MKTMTKDQFARFMAEQILEIKQYNFDVFYDISKIVNESKEVLFSKDSTEKPIKKEYHLMIRSTGCDLVNPSDDCYNTYLDRSDKIFKIVFCFNEEYFINENFVTFL